jgi:hypothetical protein
MSYQELPTDEQVEFADDMWNAKGIEVSEFFFDPPPHVMGEKRVTLKGLPPESWSLQ